MSASIRSISHVVRPIVVIIGATGSGKSKLAIEMSTKFQGEIISADSMQIYNGLDIVTNKVTKEERMICPHHLLDFINPLNCNYNVTDFRDSALPIIDDILGRNKLPVIVGGTNYYIESLLWKFILDSKQPLSTVKSELKENLNENMSLEDLHRLLCTVDPGSGYKIHPKDKRKVVRALEVYQLTGRTKSSLLVEQHEGAELDEPSGPLRFQNTCMIWVQCQQQVLDVRIDRRVEEMINAGLLKEMLEFHDRYNQQRISNEMESDYTHGIFQSIGFKEFHHYLVLSYEDRKSEKAEKLLEQGIEDMKVATRRYSRQQLKWIVNRFLKRRGKSIPPVYSVDSTRPERWNDEVYLPSASIIEAFLQGENPDQSPLSYQENTNQTIYKHCMDCDLVFVSKANWDAHIAGRRHKKTIQSKRRLDAFRSELTTRDPPVRSQDPPVVSQDPPVMSQDPPVVSQDPPVVSQDKAVRPQDSAVM